MTILLFLMLQQGVLGTDFSFITETEIFSGLHTNEVTVRPNGEVYMLNYHEARIQHYAADGTFIRNISGKGTDPGAVIQPAHFFVNDDGVFLHSLRSGLIYQFTLEGTFVTAYEAPEAELTMARTIGGWFFFKSDGSLNKAPIPGELYWSGDNFQTYKRAASIENVARAGVMITGYQKLDRGLYRPVSTMPTLIVSPDQTKLFVTHGEGLKIDVFDGSTGKLLSSISKETQLIPFDKPWAEENLLSILQGRLSQHRKLDYIRDYPEYFPAIRYTGFDPAGNLVVDRWQRPYKNNHLTAFDQSGQEIPPTYSWEVLSRFVGAANDHAYLLNFDSDREAGLAKVPLEQVEQYVKQNPMKKVSGYRITGASSK